MITSSTNWTVPQNTTRVLVTAVGGGGAGYKNGGYIAGAAGAVVNSNSVTVTPGESIPITVGAGGFNGSSGGNSSFGSYIIAGGGKGASTSVGYPYISYGGIASGTQLSSLNAENGANTSTTYAGSTMFGSGGYSYTYNSSYNDNPTTEVFLVNPTGYGSGSAPYSTVSARPGFVQVEW